MVQHSNHLLKKLTLKLRCWLKKRRKNRSLLRLFCQPEELLWLLPLSMLLLESANSPLHQPNIRLMSIKLLFKPFRVYLLSNSRWSWKNKERILRRSLRRSWRRSWENKERILRRSWRLNSESKISEISRVVVLYSEELREMRLKTKAQSHSQENIPTAWSIELIV